MPYSAYGKVPTKGVQRRAFVKQESLPKEILDPPGCITEAKQLRENKYSIGGDDCCTGV